MLCALRIYLNTVIFQFYIFHVCIRILCYIRLPVWSASRGHKYFLICCIFFMHFYKYSNTLIVLFSIYMYPYLYIYAYSTLRVLFFSITYLFCYIIFTHFYKYSNLNPIIFSYMYPYHICVLSAAYSLLLTYVLYFFKLLSISTVIL